MKFRVKIVNTLKLGSIVIISFTVIYFPFRNNYNDMIYLLSGGKNLEFMYPSPNL